MHWGRSEWSPTRERLPEDRHQHAADPLAAGSDLDVRNELLCVGEGCREDFRMRIPKPRDGVQHELELAQLHGGFRPEHTHLLLLTFGDQGELVALALPLIASRLRILHGALHVDFRFDEL